MIDIKTMLLYYSISLEVMTLNPVCENVETAEGVPLTVTGVAQVKIITEPELLNTACEQFLGKDVDHIQKVVLQTMEGHLRSILGRFLLSTNMLRWGGGGEFYFLCITYIKQLLVNQNVSQGLNVLKYGSFVSAWVAFNTKY